MAFSIRMTPASRHASTIASASCSEVAIGFSTQMHFTPVPPSRTMRTMSCVISARGATWVHTLTMSGRSRSSISR